MNILLIGSGGREHALAWAIKRSGNPGVLHISPGNAGMANCGILPPLDIADHASLTSGEKVDRLNGLEASLLGKSDHEPEGVKLRGILEMQRLTPRHAQDLLDAFRQDATKQRYTNWDDLIDYCSRSAMPVGRFVLDVHGESRATWPASDALCAALQIINHLQDCGADYRNLDRVYIPLDALAREGLQVEALGADKASPGLRRCLRSLAERTSALLRQSELFPMLVNDLRLGLEIAVIQKLARHLIGLLLQRDPLSERVHLGTAGVAALSAAGIAEGIGLRLRRRLIGGRKAQDA